MAYTTLETVVRSYSSSIDALAQRHHRHPVQDAHFAGAILLKPARRSGARLVLCPLLPPPLPKADLPSEIWARCLHFAMDLTIERAILNQSRLAWLEQCRRDLLCVSKTFRSLASPILYASIKLMTLGGLESLHSVVFTADQQWDSLRRIPFSTPGRWIQSLDVSSFSSSLDSRSAKLRADTLLSSLFRLTPFLSTLLLDPKMVLSGRAMRALAEGCGGRIRVLRGLSAGLDFGSMPPSQFLVARDPLTALVRGCRFLEVLEVFGPGQTQDEESFLQMQMVHGLTYEAIVLNRLHTLTLHGIPQSPLFFALLNSTLPSLARLTLTIYPSLLMPSHSALFLVAHGETLESLIVPTAPDWPPPDYASYNPSQTSATSPESLLHILPRLVRLNLSFPLPPLLLIPPAPSPRPHPLRTLFFPRPIPSLLPFIIEMANQSSSSLEERRPGDPVEARDSDPAAQSPTRRSSIGSLQTVVWTKSKWLRSDVGHTSRTARMSGEQAEMRRWKRVLAGRVRLLDAEGKEA